MDIEKEIRELTAAVESVRKDAKELIKTSKPSYKLTNKEVIAKSAWAKSGLSRSSSSSNKNSNKYIKSVILPGPASMNVLNQDLKSRVRAPAVSFGKRLKSKQTIGEGASKIYDIKDRYHSKTKRVSSLAFGPSTGPQLQHVHAQHIDKENKDEPKKTQELHSQQLKKTKMMTPNNSDEDEDKEN